MLIIILYESHHIFYHANIKTRFIFEYQGFFLLPSLMFWFNFHVTQKNYLATTDCKIAAKGVTPIPRNKIFKNIASLYNLPGSGF